MLEYLHGCLHHDSVGALASFQDIVHFGARGGPGYVAGFYHSCRCDVLLTVRNMVSIAVITGCLSRPERGYPSTNRRQLDGLGKMAAGIPGT